ncbi:MAG: pyridoxal-dependent decarboxylase [Acidobacteria bacterium]|nr:MAG: pyridoxal-dependent decarboxylase [Acidobacteriota bacterium]
MTLDEALGVLEADMDPSAAEPYIRVAAEYLRASAERSCPKPVPFDPAHLLNLTAEPPPAEGRPFEDVLAQVANVFVPNSNWLYHPRCMGHQVSAPLPAAIWAESITAALNQSVAVQEMSPLFTGIETGLIRWMAGLAGFGSTAGGVFTSGGTEATFTALLSARAAAFPDAWEAGVGNRAAVVITAEHSHYSVARAVAELGLGARNCLALPSSLFREEPDKLAAEIDRLLQEGRTVVAVVATAGSTAAGRFDDLQAIGAVCAERSLWLHVDGCHGASALLSPVHRHRLRGLEQATSLSWDPHKMMLLPLSASVVLVRDERLLEAAFAQRAPYLFHGGTGRVLDQGIRSFQCSRRADAFKLWIALQRYGTEVFGLLYDHLCATAAAIANAIRRRSDFELSSEPECNILCFRYVGDGRRAENELDGLNSRLRRELNNSGVGWITAARLNGRQVLRITVMNPRTRVEDGEAVLEAIAGLAKA